MNTQNYRLVYSKHLEMFIPVSEISRAHAGKGRTRGRASLAVALLAALTAPVWAAAPQPTEVPTGAVVKQGRIELQQSGSTLNIKQYDQTGIIHWDKFRIGSAARVNFNQPNVTSATLNRITGNEISIIQGALNATGAVYIINRNGVVFDKGAQVNLHTLVASTLDIKDDATFLKGYLSLGGKEAAFSEDYNNTGMPGLSGMPGKVEVAEGAYILSEAGGRIVLMAPEVDNKGKIESHGGQIVVAAGKKAFIRTPDSEDKSLLRGLIVTVESGGAARNLGTLAAGAGGDVTLVGAIVKQQGVATATTTVNVGGTVHLLAQHIDPVKPVEFRGNGELLANSTGELVIGENSRTAIMPALDRDKVALAIRAGKLTQTQVDAYHRGDADLKGFYAYMQSNALVPVLDKTKVDRAIADKRLTQTQVDAYHRGEAKLANFFDYVPDTTLQDAQAFVPSKVVARGKTISVQNGATVVAPGGDISLFARGDAAVQPTLLTGVGNGILGTEFVSSPALCLDCRVQVDSGARLDVAGLRDVAVEMDRNVVEVELRGAELRDAPLLHGETNPFYAAMYGNPTNPLYGKKIKVDIREVATVDVNGVSVERRGTTVADASGYIAQIGRKVDEKSTAGGTINLYSEGGVVVQQGATLDVSGGSLQYKDGTVTTSTLRYRERDFPVATATPDLLYVGLGADNSVPESGYVEGKNAGTLKIIAPVATLQGTLIGQTVSGRRQRGDGADLPPARGELVLGHNVNATGEGTYDYRLMNPVRFDTVKNDAPDLAIPLWADVNAPVLNPALRELVLDPNALTQNGIGRLAVYTNNAITLAAGQTLDMGAHGTVDFSAAQIDVGGNIRTAGGHVKLTTEQTAYTDSNAARVGMDPRVFDGHLTVGGAIVTAGRWANDIITSRVQANVTPLAIDGGAINLSARAGALRLERGSLLDASAGAWLHRDDTPLGTTLKVGTAGDISVQQQAPLNNGVPDKTRKLVLDGTLQSFGVLDSANQAGKGGALELQTYGNVLIGSVNRSSATTMWLGESFFSTGGFSGYALASLGGDVRVDDGARIAPRAQTRLLSDRSFAQASGANLAGFARLQTLNRDSTAKGERPATDLGLSAKAIGTGTTAPLVGGNLSVGQGAAIELDSMATLSLAADNVLSVNGALSTPGGQIRLAAGKASSVYMPTASIWLGEAASLSVKGRARTYRSGVLIDGSVLDGGDIALLANGYIRAKSGALLDASGVLGTLDLPDSSSGSRVRTQLASAGGNIRFAASEGIFVDAGATLKAAGGNADADRGTLSVELVRLAPEGTNIESFSSVPGPRQLMLHSRQADANPALTASGAALADADNGIAVLSASHLADFDHVNLKSGDRLVFADSMQVDVRGRLTLDAPTIELAAATDPAKPTQVGLNAMYLNMGNGDPLYQSAAPAPAEGTGELTVNAGLIDLTGNFALSGVDQATLNSTGDVRLVGAFTQDDLQPTSKTLVARGRLVTAGNLSLKAQQVYATTLSDFALASTKPDGRIAFAGWPALNGGVYVPPLPLSGAGRIEANADVIEQGGVLRAPLGRIVLDAAKTLTLADGSLTSVSAEGQAIPLGRVNNGRDWVYDLYDRNEKSGELITLLRTVYSGGDGVINLPAKAIQLKGAVLDVKTGATVDLSGGGDLVGYEFAAGPGGSQDYLAAPGVFAIMPTANPAFAPMDFQANRYIYTSVKSDLRPTGASQLVKPGDSVYLSAVPELGIKAGYYTLLPGRYALMPGALAVRAVAGTQDRLPGQNIRQPDGSYLVAGFENALGGANRGTQRWSGFEVAGRAVVATNNTFSFNVPAAQLQSQTLTGRSEIADYRISQLIPAINQIFGQALPRFGQDAGRLSVSAETALNLQGTLNFKPDGGLGGELDIAAPKIAVTGGGAPNVANAADYLVLDADRLTSYAVDSLMIGGTREAIATDTGSVKVSQVADAVLIDATLSAPEVMLVSKGSVTLAKNSAVIGTGAGGLTSETLVFGDDETPGSGDGVLVRASSGEVRSVVRKNVLRSGTATDGLYTASDATVRGEKSLNFDTTYSAFNLGKAELGDNGVLNLGATRISLGLTGQATQGVFVTNTLLAALGAPQEVVLKSYSNFDIEGQAALGGADMLRLTFEGAGFAGKTGTVAGDFDIAAQTVRFSNPDATALDVSGANGAATMNVRANTIELGKGVVATAGFDQVNLVALGEIAGKDRGIGGFAAAKNLKLESQRIVGYDGSETRITAGAALVTTHVAATGTILPKLADAPLGAKLALTGASIDHGGSIDLPAGWLTMTAEAGNLELKDGSEIFAGGVVRTFQGVNDTVKVYVAGGSATLDARQGDLTINKNARVDLSGSGGADAGELNIRVPQGTFTLLADLTGGAAAKTATVANPDTKTPWQGAISVDALNLSDGNATGNDFSSLLAHVKGFGEGFGMRLRAGNLTLAAGDTIKAQRVVLSADDGVLDLAGKIDSRTAEGGWVMAAAGRELYLRNRAEAGIDARATGANQRGGEVYLISGMNEAHVAAGPGNGALVLEEGSKIKVGGTLPGEVRFAGNNPGDPDIVLSQVTGGRVHLQAPRLTNGQDVRITHKALTDPTLFDSNDAIGTEITGAASVEALGNKVFSYDTPSYVLGLAQMNDLKNDTETYMSTAAKARTRLDPGSLGKDVFGNDVFQVRAGVEVRSSGDLVFGNDYDLGGITAVSGDQPGTLTLRAGGDLLVNGNLSDGFNNALTPPGPRPWLIPATLDSGESWAYNLVAGADLGASDPLAVQRHLDPGQGDFVLKRGKLIRTGTGAIHIGAGGDVEIGLGNYDPDRASVIYTAGRKDVNDPPSLKDGQDTSTAVHPVNGGALSIVAGGALRAPKPDRLMYEWLVRRGREDLAHTVTASLTWGIDFKYFNQGVGALGGGAVRIAAEQNIENLSVSLPTSGSDFATRNIGSKVLQTGGANLDVRAGGDIRGAVFYVQRGEGRIVSGGEIGAAKDAGQGGRNMVLALGEAGMRANARTGLTLDTAFNPTVAPMEVPQGNRQSLGNYLSHFFTFGADSGVNLVATQGDIVLENNSDPLTSRSNFLTGNLDSYFVYPGSLTAAAPQGDIRVKRAFTLYPSARGQLHLLAGRNIETPLNGIYMSDKDLSQLPSLRHPSIAYVGPESSKAAPSPVPVHLEDSDPVRLYAEQGNITGAPGVGLGLRFSKPVEILAGRDIVDLSVIAQNLKPDQTSIFRAGRDIRYSATRKSEGQLTSNGEGIRLGGPGYLEVVTGRHLDLGTTGGIVTTGNLDNPALAYGGADTVLLVGMGSELDAQGRPRPRLPDTEAFLAAKGELALVDFYAGLLDYERLRQALLDPDNAALGYKEVLDRLEAPAYRARMAALAQPEYLLAKKAFEKLLNSSVVSERAQAARRLYFNELQQASSESSVLKQLAGLGFDLNTLNTADQPGAIAGFSARLAQADLPASTLERYTRFFERAKLLIERHRQQPDYSPVMAYDVKTELGYAGRADTAIAHYLPEHDYAGDFGGFYSQVRTEQGNDFDMLTPGGSVTAGLVNAELVDGKTVVETKVVNGEEKSITKEDSSKIGFFTINGGAIRSYSKGDFLVNSSRVFTLGWEATLKRSERQRLLRDDIFLYSQTGDVDAGKGAKTTSSTPPPTFTTDDKGFTRSNIGAAISGSGIGVLLAREVINRGTTYLIAPKGTVNAGDAGIRALGDLFIDANRVVGLNNIVSVGLSIGVPVAVDTSGLNVAPAGLNDAAKAASDATGSLAGASEDAQKAAEDMRQSLAAFKPNLISVEVLGFGNEDEDECKSGDAAADAACRKRKQQSGT